VNHTADKDVLQKTKSIIHAKNRTTISQSYILKPIRSVPADCAIMTVFYSSTSKILYSISKEV
jgi:hypothetical protein